MTHRLTQIGLALLTAMVLHSPALAWQDLAPDYVKSQVERIADPATTRDERAKARAALILSGRAAIDPLIQTARAEPKHRWTVIHLLESIRTDAQVVRYFSALLDGADVADNEKLGGEIRGFLIASLQDMTGQRFKTSEARRAWVKAHADRLAWDDATMRFVGVPISEKLRHRGITQRHDISPRGAAGAAYFRLILALTTGHKPTIDALVAKGVRLVETSPSDTVPALVLDRFRDRPRNHRALRVVARDGGWLFRSGQAYLIIKHDGTSYKCVEAGMKPID